jgi:gliding motility-associated lipoprotein GldH
MRKLHYLFLLLALFAVACSNHKVFDEVLSVQNNEWNSSNKLEFTVPINDTASAFDISIHVRNSNDYEYSNLWLFIATEAPTGISMVDTVEFFLAEPSGKWLGTGLGAVNSMLIPYKSNIRFPNRGIYHFELKHAMRQEQLLGIMDIGIRIDKHTNN